MYSKILLPLDGSDHAGHAQRHAAAIASAMGAEIVVLHVLDTSLSVIESVAIAGDPATATGPSAYLSLEERRLRERLEAESELDRAREAFEAAGIAVSVEFAEGEAGETIVERARALGCDLVVMSSHGRGGFKRAVLGSVTDHVIRHTPGAAVLVVVPDREDD